MMMEVSQTPALSLQELQSKNSSDVVLAVQKCELDKADDVQSKEVTLKEYEETTPVMPFEEGPSKDEGKENVFQYECIAALNGEMNGDAAEEENKTILFQENLNCLVGSDHQTSSEGINIVKQKVKITKGVCKEKEFNSVENEASDAKPTNSVDNTKPYNIPDNLCETKSSPAEVTEGLFLTESDDNKGIEIQKSFKTENRDDRTPTKQTEIEVRQKKPEDVITIDDDKFLANNIEAINEGLGTDDFLSKLNSAIGDGEDENSVVDKTAKQEELDDDIILIDSPMRHESSEKCREKHQKKLTPKENETSDADLKPANSIVEVGKKEDVLESDDDDVVLLDLPQENFALSFSNKLPPKQSPVEKSDNEKPEIALNTRNNEVEGNKTEVPPVTTNEDDEDDDVVFVECNENKSSNVKKTEKMKDESTNGKGNKNEKQSLGDDDVVLLDDDKVEDNEKVCPKDDEGNVMDPEEILTIEVGQQKTLDNVPTNVSNPKVDPIDEKCEGEIKSISNKSETKQSNLENDALKMTGSESKNKEKIFSDNCDNSQDKTVEGGSDSNKDIKSDNGNARDHLLKTSTSSPHSSSDSISLINKATNDENSMSSKSKPPPSKRKRLSEGSDSAGLSLSHKVEVECIHTKDSMHEEINAYVKPSKSNSLKRSLSPFGNADTSETKKQKMFQHLNDDNNDGKDHTKNTLENAMGLEFLKQFKSPLSTMTRTQLEELVLQKVAEALVYKSEFSRFYELIEKQEQMLKTYQSKCIELTKQFRDLEMVHTRVAKDLQARNSQFVMPVKITRAVGLQVLVPKNSHKTSEASASSTGSSASNSLLPANQVNNKIDQNLQRGRCMQKTTPMRPVPDILQQQGVQQIQSNRNVFTVKQNVNLASTQALGSQNKYVYKPVRPDTIIVGGHSQLEQPTTVMQTSYPAQLQVVQTGPPMTQIPNNSSHTLNTVRKSTAAQQHFTLTQKTLISQPDRLKVPPVVLKKSGTNGRMSVTPTPVAPVGAVPQNSSPARGNKSFIDLTDDEEAFPRKLQAQANVPALVAIPNNNTSTQVAANHPKTSPQRAHVATQNGAIPQKVASAKTNNFAPKQTTAVTTITNRMPANPQIGRRAAHPAPLPKAPPAPTNSSLKAVPPNPRIRINNIDSGIVISWTMDDMSELHADIALYQIYAYQETSAAPSVDSWRHVGDVRALLLPMAVTLTQFQEGQRYYFAVRAVDVHNRYGPFSAPKTWL